MKCYGEKVAHLLKEKEIPTTFTLSRDDIDLMLREYSGFFTETTINGEKGILLSDQKNYDDMMGLLGQLCQYMPNLFLTAFLISRRSVCYLTSKVCCIPPLRDT